MCIRDRCWICGQKYSENHFENSLFGCPMMQFTNHDWGFCQIFVYLILITVFWPLILLFWSFQFIFSSMCGLECGNGFNVVIVFCAIIGAPIIWAVMLIPTQLYRIYVLFYILNRVCIDCYCF
eukprot:TRINITY_DN10640_c0_g1_i6.p1 TRINITY_DN10640_c0_g1~~TRINITY_DN10640_c0_g1_i6.p1  ORF type:complete len:123 (-),score=8.96 TRINITY_DN10640_c0_g1_i6:103-471(-)